ncbi:MAG TPA: OmpA family protein [Chthoniobacterales bacterium]|nr:OmpA family protein [Chthoniobacterales bacterium]
MSSDRRPSGRRILSTGLQNEPPPKKTPAGVWVIVGLGILFALGALGIGAFIAVKSLKEKGENSEAANPSASAKGSVVPDAQATSQPSATVSAEAITSDAKEQDQTRKEVLTRIDVMKNLSQKEKDELYAQVERARSFSKIAVIPFDTAKVNPTNSQVADLVKRLQETENKKLLNDPTVVLFFVGYADKQGDESKNQEISRTRAEAVEKALTKSAKLTNITHSVGMGGQDLFDKANLVKNRLVEVWAVQP